MNHSSPENLLKMRLDVPRPRFYTGLGLFLLGMLLMMANDWMDTAQIPLLIAALCMLLGAVVFFVGVHLLVKARNRHNTMGTCLERLKEDGMLEKAAAALEADETGHLGEQCRLAGGFLFSEEMGLVLPEKEIGWVYIRYTGFHRLTLLTETYSFGRFLPLMILPKNAGDAEKNELLQTAEALFPKALIGYSKENKAAWKALRQAWEEAEIAAAEAAEKAAEEEAEDSSEE